MSQTRTRDEILTEARNSNENTEQLKKLKALSVYHIEQLMTHIMRLHIKMGKRDDNLVESLKASHRLNQQKYKDMDDLYSENEANIRSIIKILNDQKYFSDIEAYLGELDKNKDQNSDQVRLIFQRVFPDIKAKSSIPQTPTPTNTQAQINTPQAPTNTAQSNAPTETPTSAQAQSTVQSESSTINRRKGQLILNEVLMNPSDPHYDEALKLHNLYQLIKNMINTIDKDESSKEHQQTLRQALDLMKTKLEVGLLSYDDI